MDKWSTLPDGTRLASASSDKTVIVWNPNTGSNLAILDGHDASVFACAWSPDGGGFQSSTFPAHLKLNVWDTLGAFKITMTQRDSG